MSRFPEHRDCRLCGARAPTSDLVHYAVRAYAHAACLFRRRGEAALAELHAHQIRALPVLALLNAGFGTTATILDRLQALERAAAAREEARRASVG